MKFSTFYTSDLPTFLSQEVKKKYLQFCTFSTSNLPTFLSQKKRKNVFSFLYSFLQICPFSCHKKLKKFPNFFWHFKSAHFFVTKIKMKYFAVFCNPYSKFAHILVTKKNILQFSEIPPNLPIFLSQKIKQKCLKNFCLQHNKSAHFFVTKK